MKLEYHLSKLAENDLENIWEYTFTNWSKKQADLYVQQIFEQVDIICINPELGRSIFRIKQNHRISKVNSHLIVYKVEDVIIKIDRFIHERMYFEIHI